MASRKLSNNPVSTMDEVISDLGGFSRFQLAMNVVFSGMMFPYVFQILMIYFTGEDPPWKCRSNSSICLFNVSMHSYNNARCSMSRSEWEYTVPDDFSLTTQFDLQCEREWMHQMLGSLLFVGWGLGAIVFGYLADNYGRKVILITSYTTLVSVSFLSSFVLNYPLMAACMFIIGCCIPGIQVQGFTIVCELIGPKQRPKAMVMPSVAWSLAMCILPLHAYYIRKWKTLMIVCSVPYAILIPFAIRIFPESIRWLRLEGRAEEAMLIIGKIAHCNKRKIPDNLDLEAPASIKNNKNISNIFRTPKLALRSVTQAYIWLASGLVYYGLALAAGNLGGSRYLNFFLLAVVGVPGGILALYLVQTAGRKKTSIISMFVVSICCGVVSIVPRSDDMKVLRIAAAMIGKFSINVSFAALYVWVVELYPTEVRTNGMGFLQLTARIGASASPWVAKGLLRVHRGAPFILMAAVSLLASGVLFLLPETKDLPTAETIEDVEAENNGLLSQKSLKEYIEEDEGNMQS